jgi:phosphoinositide-3-kinase regulatory subunit 4
MGQNYSSTAAADSIARAGIDIPELADVSYEKSLGSARFLKTIRARHHDGMVVIKIFAKPLASFPLERHRDHIIRTLLCLISLLRCWFSLRYR